VSQQLSSIMIINLLNGEAFIFQFFPTEIELEALANWRAQETTIGVQPLFYASRAPQRLTFPKVWMDSTHTGESLTPEIVKLLDLQKETEVGTPPPLLVSWGDSEFRCVLGEVRILQQFFNAEGHPLRAELSLVFLELQEEPRAAQPVLVKQNAESSFTF
jgi:hypothetical protein